MSTKKVFAAILTVFVAFAAVAPASAVTVEELLAQIAALQAQLLALQGGSSSTYVGVLTKNLSMGMTDPEVNILQQGLAKDSTVYPEGLVTGYFGPLTKAAVVKFQQKYAAEILTPNGLTAGTGYVGASTRAKFNALYGVMTSATPTPSGSAAPSATPSTPVEGSITVTQEGVPADGTQVKAGMTDVAINAVKVKANTSDMAVQRMYVNFGLRPNLYFSEVSIWDGTQKLASLVPSSATVEEVTAGSDYRMAFTGFSILIAKDQYKVLTVKVSVLGSSTSGSWPSSGETVTIKQNALRAVDGMGISQYGPDANLTARTYDVMATDTASIEVLSNTTTPAEGIIAVSSTTTATEKTVLVFDLKAKDSAATLQKVEVDITSGSQNLSGMVTAARLYQGSTLLASTSTFPAATTGEAVFNLTSPYVTLNQDVATTFTVKLDFAAITGSEIGDYVMASIDDGSGDFTAETVGTYASVTAFSGTVSGKKQYLFQNYPSLALVSVTGPTLDPNTSTIAQATLRMSVTANGADIYVPKASTGVPVYGFSVGSDAYAWTTSTVAVGTIEAGTNNYIVRAGQTATFDVNVVMDQTNASATAGFRKSWIYEFEWSTGDVGSGWTSWTNKLGLGTGATTVGDATFKTGEIYMAAN